MRTKMWRWTAPGAMVVLAGLVPANVWADGSETLGPPLNLTVASGSGAIAAGVGLATQPGTINLTVPAGCTVKQVLLYWEGLSTNPSPGDASVVINGNSVAGTLIGGPTIWFADAGTGSQIQSSSFRADITSLGLVHAGANTLTVDGVSFGFRDDGAAVMVIFDDATTFSSVQIRDGNDLAYAPFTPPLNAALAQTFTFASTGAARLADLALLLGGIEADQRPNSIAVVVDGTTTIFSNELSANGGLLWDTFHATASIPAGASTLTVQPISRDDLNSGRTPASFAWVGAVLTVPLPCSGRIGDFVWHDRDGNGRQESRDNDGRTAGEHDDGEEEDESESGIRGVRVTLKDALGSLLGTTTTDGSGLYEFGGLCAGVYSVKVDASTLPTGFIPSPCNVGKDRRDNDCSPAGVTLVSDATTDLTIDFGYNNPTAGSQGCGQGFWKNHTGSWKHFSPTEMIRSVFIVPPSLSPLGPKTLAAGLAFRGGSGISGGAQIMLRQAIGALLNASHPSIDFPLSRSRVTRLTNEALASNRRDTMLALADALERANSLGCPLR